MKGRKRQLLVDTQGTVLKALVHPAGGKALLEKVVGCQLSLLTVLTGGWETLGAVLEVVERSPDQTGGAGSLSGHSPEYLPATTER